MTANIGRISFKHSFATKICLWMLVTTACVYILSSYGASRLAGRMMLEDGHKKANLELDKAVLYITDEVNVIENAAHNFASFLEMSKVEQCSDTAVKAMLENFLLTNPSVQGVAVCFEPEYFKQYKEGYAPYQMQYSDGTRKFVNIADWGLYRKAVWYIKPKMRMKPCWTEPFKETNGSTVCSYMVPLTNDKGKFIGILGLDLSLERFSDAVQNLKPYADSHIAVTDQDLHFVVHPDTSVILKRHIDEFFASPKYEVNDSILANLRAQRRGFGAFSIQGDEKFLYFAPIRRLDWMVTLECDKEEIMAEVSAIQWRLSLISVVGLLSLFFIAFFIVRRMLRPIKLYSAAALHIAKGNFHTPLPKIKEHDELWVLGDALDYMQQSLEKYIGELKDTTQEKARIESELDIASKIQMAMVPKIFPPYPEREDVDLYATLIPAKAVGGDLYDFFLRDEKLFFCIGDVSGKGVPASLLMAVTRSLLRIVAAQESRPDRIVASLNNSMADMNETNMFVTLFVGVLDLPTGRFRYCNAGHNAPVIVDGDTHEVRMLDVKPNLPVAVMPNWTFELQETEMKTDSTLFMYTDGLTEAENARKELFGEERMMEVLRRMVAQSTKDQIDAMLDAVHRHVDGAEQSDDLTMVALGYKRLQRDTKFYRKRILHNDIRETPKITDFIDDIVGETGIDMPLACSLNLALEEAVVNVMNYAYPQGKQGNIIIESYAFDGCLKFVITDNGVPFDPTTVKEPDVTAGINERTVGGLGVFLVKRIMDKMEYKRVNGNNVLTLSKKLDAGDNKDKEKEA